MFFVLSGFLITYRYFNDAPIHFKKYLINRFSRIYPMYFLLTTAAFLVKFFQQGWTTLDSWAAVFSFTLTKALFTTFRYSGISQGWTLTFEELFYFSAPLFFMIIRKYRKAIYLLPIAIFPLHSWNSKPIPSPRKYLRFSTDQNSCIYFWVFRGHSGRLSSAA